MRKKECFRPNLEKIRDHFGERQWLKIKDVCEFLGICRNTVAKRYPDIIKKRDALKQSLQD